MEKLTKPNVKKPLDFRGSLYQVVASMHDLFQLTKEFHLPPVVDGCQVYFEEDGMCGSQAARQFDRPEEFLQCVLDLLRVEFEPYALGSIRRQ